VELYEYSKTRCRREQPRKQFPSNAVAAALASALAFTWLLKILSFVI